MTAKLQHDAGRARARLPAGIVRLAIGQGHLRAALGQQMRRSDTTPRRAHDEHALTAHGKVLCRHRSFNVVRLKRAKMMAMIRKRVITFGSSQPLNSK